MGRAILFLILISAIALITKMLVCSIVLKVFIVVILSVISALVVVKIFKW